jgi:hypothetical protein
MNREQRHQRGDGRHDGHGCPQDERKHNRNEDDRGRDAFEQEKLVCAVMNSPLIFARTEEFNHSHTEDDDPCIKMKIGEATARMKLPLKDPERLIRTHANGCASIHSNYARTKYPHAPVMIAASFLRSVGLIRTRTVRAVGEIQARPAFQNRSAGVRIVVSDSRAMTDGN